MRRIVINQSINSYHLQQINNKHLLPIQILPRLFGVVVGVALLLLTFCWQDWHIFGRFYSIDTNKINEPEILLVARSYGDTF